MNNNRNLKISTGSSRKSMFWPKSEIMWSEFVGKLKTPVKSVESYNDYLALSKSVQDDLKDVGGFVGGTFAGDRRKASYVEGRDLITLDMDNIPTGGTIDILKRIGSLGCAAVVYSTRKHAEFAPRLRVIIPLDKTASPDEYEPAARKLASLIGIEFCDPTTFEASRLMYWPSISADGVYVYQVYDAPFCSLDSLLAKYQDWRNIQEWPQVPGSEAIEKRRVAKQEDPTTKRGVVGSFCRAYSILEAMEKFIPNMYEPTDIPGRYTYLGGSTIGGAVVYDGDTFLFSHHATDPCSGQLVNAFDLVRLHLFGDLDTDIKDGTPVVKHPSYVQMSRLVSADSKVQDLTVRERYERAQTAFQVDATEDSLDWIKYLTVDGNNQIERTINNIVTILENDPLLKGKIATDEFANRGLVLGTVPWNNSPEKRMWADVDDAGLRRYLETFYRIVGKEKMDDALLIVSDKHKINEVKEYFKSLTWDGAKRLDTLLIDYLGAHDTKYARTIIRKVLCAAVARTMGQGVKFDNMMIIVGPQGSGKSTLVSTLGGKWFSDSLMTFAGKEASELIQGFLINEIGELAALSKQETNTVKQFLSRTHDVYRAPYGKRTDKYPRRGIFIGTSNEAEFLKDATGNRRFWPIETGLVPPTKSVWVDLPIERDQIWAEAYVYWQFGEQLYLPKEVEKMAEEQQNNYKETSSKEGIVREFLDKEIPVNWNQMSSQNRKLFLSGGLKTGEEVELRERNIVCAAEIWIECFNGEIKFMKRSDSVEINNILRSIEGWQKMKTPRKFGPHGSQKGFERVTTFEKNILKR